MRRKACLAIGLMALCGAANADQEQGFTAGIGITRNSFDLNPDAAFGLEGSDDSTGFNVFGGYRFNRYAAIEVVYMDTGSIEREILGADVDFDGKAYGASVMGTWPLLETFALYGRLGMLKGELDATVTVGNVSQDGDFDDDTEVYFGAGLIAMLDGAQIRLEYSTVDFELVDTDQLSLSIGWLF